MAVEGIRTAQVSPKFLHGNSTSHTWLFSAFAELIDNAYDPDVNARELKIDVRHIYDQDCLTFLDNGNGMTPDKLYKMLSFGYSEKTTVHNTKPIGQYGNGFKSGSMRIGRDALVFTRCKTSMSVGMLSQTYLSNIKAEALVVPTVTFDLQSNLLQENQESLASKEAITKYSIFNSEHQLKLELEEMAKMETGTSIIIYNLKKDESGNYEIDFESDKTDIRNPETQMKDMSTIDRPIRQQSPEYERSLREYCSILYLKPRMRITIRGQKVATKPIRKSLQRTATYYYNPSWIPRKVPLTFGFNNNRESESYGIMVYHNNRLIKAYEKVGCQKQRNALGIGVVGVVEANFLEPIHNKQDFKRTEKYSAFMQNVSIKLNKYFNEITQNENTDIADSLTQSPNWNWVQCDNCDKWRRAPEGYNVDTEKPWYCKQNPDAEYNRCDIPEEPEDDNEALQPTNKKTYEKTFVKKRRHAKLEKEKKLNEKQEQLSEPEKQHAEAKQHQDKGKQLQKKKKMTEKDKVTEISSSQGTSKIDHTTTLGIIEEAQQPISAYQEKEKQIEIQQLEVEENSQAISGMTGSLILPIDERTSLCEKIQEMNGADSSTVTLCSGSTNGLRAPKRKHDMVNSSTKEEEPGAKVVKITAKDGGISVIVQDKDEQVKSLNLDEDDPSESNSAPDPSEGENSGKTDESCDRKGSETKAASDELTEMDDVKPDREELDKNLTEIDNDKVETYKDEVVKFASPEEVDLLKLSPVEQERTLLLKSRELEETKKNLRSLQYNILKLLKKIEPDFDHGEPGNIEKKIVDLIRKKEQQETFESQSKADQGE